MKKQSYFITRISRIIEKTTLCMSCYDMIAKYEVKVINKNSAIYLFHLNDIWFALAFMFIPAKKRRNSPSKVKDFVFKLYAALKHQFDPQCLDDEITRFFIISNTFFSSALVLLNILMN